MVHLHDADNGCDIVIDSDDNDGDEEEDRDS